MWDRRQHSSPPPLSLSRSLSLSLSLSLSVPPPVLCLSRSLSTWDRHRHSPPPSLCLVLSLSLSLSLSVTPPCSLSRARALSLSLFVCVSPSLLASLKVTAFDAHRTELVSHLSPEGTIRFCTPNAPTPNNLDSWGWQFTITAPEGAKIKYIRIDQVGTDPDPSFGFDNFVAYTRCVPEAVCDWDPLAQQRVICPNIKSLFNTLCRIECGQPVCPGLDEAAIRAACQTDEAPAEAN